MTSFSNDRIHIQIIKFQFKRINQKPPRHYHPPVPMTDGSADITTWPGSSADDSASPVARNSRHIIQSRQ
jgi:hypothetical protein